MPTGSKPEIAAQMMRVSSAMGLLALSGQFVGWRELAGFIEVA